MTAMLDWVLVVAGLPWLGASLYLLGLTLLWRRPESGRPATSFSRVCVVVPAHNEERGIAETIRSLRAVDYPVDRWRLVVVADNCHDRTAAVAAALGAHVIVRVDPTRRGKGWALRFAIDRLLDRSLPLFAWDALVVVDADTVVAPNLFRVLASHLESGARAVQAAYLPRRGSDSPHAVITDVAFTAFHVVRSAARERLGLSSGLRGNGMAFRRDLLEEVPHDAVSLTEDVEFGLRLGLRGVRVAFAGATRVFGEMPDRPEAVAGQRARWIGGRVAMARGFVGPLLHDAVRRRSLVSADLAADLLVPPLSMLVVASASGLAASLALALVAGTVPWAAGIWSAACAALAAHVGHAAVVTGRAAAFVQAAGSIPAYALSKTLIALRARRPSQDQWVRTARKGEIA